MAVSLKSWVIDSFILWTKNGSIIPPPIPFNISISRFIFGVKFSHLIEPAFKHTFKRTVTPLEKKQISFLILERWGSAVKTSRFHLYCLKYSQKSELQILNNNLEQYHEKVFIIFIIIIN